MSQPKSQTPQRGHHRSHLQGEDYVLPTYDYETSTEVIYVKYCVKGTLLLSSISSACWCSRGSASEVWGEVEKGSERCCKCDSRSRRAAIAWDMRWTRSSSYGQQKVKNGLWSVYKYCVGMGPSREATRTALAGGTGSSLVQQLVLTSLPRDWWSTSRQMFTRSGLSVRGSRADVEGTANSRWCFNLAEKGRMCLSGSRLKQTHLHSKSVKAQILTVSG